MRQLCKNAAETVFALQLHLVWTAPSPGAVNPVLRARSRALHLLKWLWAPSGHVSGSAGPNGWVAAGEMCSFGVGSLLNVGGDTH